MPKTKPAVSFLEAHLITWPFWGRKLGVSECYEDLAQSDTVECYDKKIWYCNQNAPNGAIKKSIKHHTAKISCLTLTACNDAKCRTLTGEADIKK